MTYLMVIAQELVKKINGIIADESLVFCVNEGMPIFLWESPQYIIILRIQLDIIFI